MKNRNLFVSLFVVVSMMVCAGPAASVTMKKFTASDIKKAKMTLQKPKIVLSWETKVKLANDALARDAATVKSGVDGILERANQKYVNCAAKDYTIQELQSLCKPDEGVKECIDRLVGNCVIGQATQQMTNSMADAVAATSVKSALDNMKRDITNLENALFK